MLGKIVNYIIEKNVVKINFENGSTYVKIINDEIINFFIPNVSEERNSKAIDKLNYKETKFSVRFIGQLLTISTKSLVVKIYAGFNIDIYDKDGNALCEDYRLERDPFIRRKGDYELAESEGHDLSKKNKDTIYIAKKMEDDMHFYGLGEKTGHLDKKYYHYKNWNTDNPNPHGETFEQLYKSIPFFVNFRKDKSFGIFFDNTFETNFDFGKENSNYYYFSAAGGNTDYYFIYGPSVKNVIEGYTYLTGTTPLPQLWTLGYQQCRWSYSPELRVWEVAEEFRKRDIPCDTIYLDIDYMDEYRVFTWDNNKFPHPEKTIRELKEEGFKVVTIIDPGVKVDNNYSIYKEGIENNYFAKDKNGQVYENVVWPGKAVYPNFLSSDVQKWWSRNQKILTDSGVSGIWNDMNEPASFNGPLPDDIEFNEDDKVVYHKEAHNVYGQLMCKATYKGIKDATKKRPFVVTRACYAGIQKYSTCWTGDNQSTWEHLRMAVPMLMNMGISGVAFCGTDVGGFGFDCSKELLSRWVQVGAFTPLFRNHSSMGTRDQEPWAFDKMTEDINRKYIKLRYSLLPYLYDCMKICEDTGIPVMKPLILNYEADKETYEINDEFLFGDNILVSPVLEQGKDKKMVYLPNGDKWIDFWDNKEYDGGQYIIKDAPIDICPIFVKASSVIPSYEVQNYVGEKVIDTLKLNIYLSNDDNNFEYTHYVDDGKSFAYKYGEYSKYRIVVKGRDEVVIDVNKIVDGYCDQYEYIEIIINKDCTNIICDGENVKFKKVRDKVHFTVALKANQKIVIK
ncbi:glycoside hydrolase family 31 protein [Inconstantimicrobium porci]|uniref:glycoside hydrolase family 31 protein n=1 Tax=Inconstantimicrobium porci TaxID=2652291 RepID=UPI002409053B|nr:glycoside hydrolase family 31 protein [Inconstantimicrobium porci]MDD6770301.1 glycoside hydrolase family 31 protein [Inconstantimicrobium porci]